LSTSRDSSSPSSQGPSERAREYGRLLGDKGIRLSCENMKEILSGKGRAIGEPPPLLLDVREGWEHRYVRFPDSLHIPLSRLPENLERIPSNHPVIVYCHTGIRSLLACYLLLENDYQTVYNLEGGIDAWSREIDSRIPRYSLEPGRRPPSSVLEENRKGELRTRHNPWGEGLQEEILRPADSGEKAPPA